MAVGFHLSPHRSPSNGDLIFYFLLLDSELLDHLVRVSEYLDLGGIDKLELWGGASVWDAKESAMMADTLKHALSGIEDIPVDPPRTITDAYGTLSGGYAVRAFLFRLRGLFEDASRAGHYVHALGD